MATLDMVVPATEQLATVLITAMVTHTAAPMAMSDTVVPATESTATDLGS